MKVIDSGTITGIPSEINFRSKTFPAFEKLPSGRWLAGFKAGEKKKDAVLQQAMMTWSDDQGRSWAQPYAPVTLPAIDEVPGHCSSLYFLTLGETNVLMVLNWVDSSDPAASYYDPMTESLKETRIFYCFSQNDGLSWTQPLLMDTTSAGGPVPLTGPPFRMKNGSIACQFEINKYKEDPHKWIHRSALIFSKDGGHTWGNLAIVTEEPDRYYWDQRPNVLDDGKTVVNFFWALDGKKQEYLNIHVAYSEDGGKTWTRPMDTGIYGQPGRPVALQDGKLATIDIDRSISPTITVRISGDRGKTYDEALVIFQAKLPSQDSRTISMNEAWQEMAAFSVGHPNLLDLGNGEILAYFYQGEQSDQTDIAFIRIAISMSLVKKDS